MKTLKLVCLISILTISLFALVMTGCKKDLQNISPETHTHPHTRGGYAPPNEETSTTIENFYTHKIGNGYINYYVLDVEKIQEYMMCTGASTIGIYDVSYNGEEAYVVIPIDNDYHTIVSECLLNSTTYISSTQAKNMINECKTNGRRYGTILPISTTQRLISISENIKIYNIDDGTIVANTNSRRTLPCPDLCDYVDIPYNLYKLDYTSACPSNCDFY